MKGHNYDYHWITKSHITFTRQVGQDVSLDSHSYTRSGWPDRSGAGTCHCPQTAVCLFQQFIPGSYEWQLLPQCSIIICSLLEKDIFSYYTNINYKLLPFIFFQKSSKIQSSIPPRTQMEDRCFKSPKYSHAITEEASLQMRRRWLRVLGNHGNVQLHFTCLENIHTLWSTCSILGLQGQFHLAQPVHWLTDTT